MILGMRENMVPERCPVHGWVIVNPPPAIEVTMQIEWDRIVFGKPKAVPAGTPFCVDCVFPDDPFPFIS